MDKKTRIRILLVVDTAFFLLELISGYTVHSLALVADSFHMFNDILSLVVALWAVQVAKSGSSATYTYGLQRAEILGALVNGVFLLALCVTIALEAIQRFVEVPEVTNPKLILIVGTLGLLSNILGLLLFHEHEHGHSHGQSHDEEQQRDDNSDGSELLLPAAAVEREENRLLQRSRNYGTAGMDARDLAHPEESPSSTPEHDHGHSHGGGKSKSNRSMNMEGVWLHVLGDALGNIGVIATALFIWKTDFSWKMYADPAISLVIACIIFSSAMPLCKRAGRVLLQATPSSINATEVREDVEGLPGVVDIHDLHIWQLNENSVVATLHVSVDLPPADFPELAKAIQKCFANHDIPSITIQPEFVEQGSASGLRQCVSFGNMSTGGLNTNSTTNTTRG